MRIIAYFVIGILALSTRCSAKTTAQEECGQADLAFVVDSSGSIGKTNWVKVLSFLENVVNALPIGNPGYRVGVVTFGYKATVNFYLNEHRTAPSLKSAIKKIRYLAEYTNTSGGIATMHNKLFVSGGGDRDGIPNIGVVVVDGNSNRDPQKTAPEAERARELDIHMLSLGITSGVGITELSAIADRPSRDNVIHVSSFNNLPSIQTKLVSAICKVATTKHSKQEECTENDALLTMINDLQQKVDQQSKHLQGQLNQHAERQHAEEEKLESLALKIESSEDSIGSSGKPINLKQCSHVNLNELSTNGIISACAIVKKRSETALRVSWNGVLRLTRKSKSHEACRRYYMTINKRECSKPAPIDAVIKETKLDNYMHRPAFVEGLCTGVPAGLVQVKFHIGPCRHSGYEAGDVRIGWGSTTRMILEEVNVRDVKQID